MGLTNIYAKYVVVMLLFPALAWGQVTTTTIPGKLRIKTVPNSPALGDSVLTISTTGDVKKIVTPGGGGSATGVNGLNGTTNIGLGGTLSQNTTENLAGFNFNLNQTTGNIQQWQASGTTVANVDIGGTFYISALRAFSNVNDALMTTRSNGFLMSRNRADSVNVLTVVNKNPSSFGAIFAADNAWRDAFVVSQNGMIKHTSGVGAVAGQAVGYYLTGMLSPSANNDNLIGMQIAPMFGTSVISSLSSLVGGTGYTNGSFSATLSGGTGRGASGIVTVSGGAVVSYTPVIAGVNYTVGDVLTITSIDGNTPPHGSGATITVSSVTAFTGINKIALQTYGLDTYDQDYTYTALSKPSKNYVDKRTVSSTYSTTASSTTTFTVSIGATQPNNMYKVQVTPASAIAAGGGFYVTNRTTTTFDVVYPAGLTGAVSFFWLVTQ